MTEEDLLTRAEAAARLGVHPRTLDRWARAGALPYVTLGPGKRRRYRVANVDRMIGTPDEGNDENE